MSLIKPGFFIVTLIKHKILPLSYLLMALLLLNPGVGYADVWKDLYSEQFQPNEGVEDYSWKEGSSTTPDYPQDKDLIEVAGPPAYRNYKYLIDAKNLQAGKDGVIRYSIVIRSPGGSDNTLYQGLRCISSQIKTYAYGSTDMNGKKQFIVKQNPSWKAISETGVTGHSKVLAANYFCTHDGMPMVRHEIIQNIKYGKGEVDGVYY